MGRAWRRSEGPPRARAGWTYSCLSRSVAGSSDCWYFQKQFELSHRLFFKSGVLGTVLRRKNSLGQSIHMLSLIPFGLPTWQVKNLPAMHKVQVRTLGPQDPLGKEVATHASVLAWGNPVDRGAWQPAVRGSPQSIAHDLETKQQC